MKIKGWTNWELEEIDEKTSAHTRLGVNNESCKIVLYREKSHGFIIWLYNCEELIPFLKEHFPSYTIDAYHWYSFKSLKEAKALIDGFLVRLNRLKAFT